MAPASTRAGVPPSSRAMPGGTRGDELSAAYRKLADTQAALTEVEARLERAVTESAGADEMVGQMLARVADVEARLRSADEARAEAEARARHGEARAADLSARLDKARAEADGLFAATEELEAQVRREREERETLRVRVVELSQVCEERDRVLLREEILEAELGEARELQAHAEAAAAQVIGAAEIAAAHAERDALLVEARQLRTALDAVARVLADAGCLGAAEPPGEVSGDRYPQIALAGSPISAGAAPRRAGIPLALPGDDDSNEDEPTQIFSDVARELVARELARGRGSGRG